MLGFMLCLSFFYSHIHYAVSQVSSSNILYESDKLYLHIFSQELVPCVLLSFDDEQILMWRGRDWKSRFLDYPLTPIPSETNIADDAGITNTWNTQKKTAKGSPHSKLTPINCF